MLETNDSAMLMYYYQSIRIYVDIEILSFSVTERY